MKGSLALVQFSRPKKDMY